MFNEIHLRNIKRDISRGISATIVALPLALAFGVTSGAGAVAGIWCAVITGFFTSLFGGTPTQITGPTGPLAVIVAALLSQYIHNPTLAFTVVCMGGLFQILFGYMKLGRYVTLIPYPVVTGFMSGIGVIICIMQLGPLLGYLPAVGGVKVSISQLPDAITHPNFISLFVGAFTFFVMSFPLVKKIKFIPPPLIALILGTIVTLILPFDLPKLDEIQGNPPAFLGVAFEWELLGDMINSALVIAFLGSINSLLASLVADNMTGKAHNSDQELIGQGIGNMAAGLFGVLPGAGATMRTAANIRSGGRTAVSGFVHAGLMLIIVLLLAPFAVYVSYSVLAGILMKVGMDIIDWHFIKRIFIMPRTVALLAISVFLMTIFVNYIAAVTLGMIAASILLTKQLAELQDKSMSEISTDMEDHEDELSQEEKDILKEYPGQIALFKMVGTLSFGASRSMQRRLRAMGDYDVLVLDFSRVIMADSITLFALEDIIENNKNKKKEILMFGLREEIKSSIEKSRMVATIQGEQIFTERVCALRKAKEIIKKC